jgi:uncharacterized membrane protein
VKRIDFSSDRIIGISDGVFAVAMTLLVLDLKLPALVPSADHNVLAAALTKQIPRFISWILSFAILCRLWIIHHGLMRAGDTRSWRFLTWNLIFLSAVAFIPFPTSLLSEHHDQALSVIVFSATYLVASLALVGMAVAYRRQTRSAGAATEESSVARIAAIMVAVALSSCLLALVHPWLGVLIWAVYPFASAVDRRSSHPAASQAGDGG